VRESNKADELRLTHGSVYLIDELTPHQSKPSKAAVLFPTGLMSNVKWWLALKQSFATNYEMPLLV
jgi:hypothetical protein